MRLLLLLLLLFPFIIIASDKKINISIFSNNNFKSLILFKAEKGNYRLFFSKESIDITPDDLLYISKSKKGYHVFTADKKIDYFQESFFFSSQNDTSVFRISIDNDERLYQGDLRIEGLIETKLINTVSIDNYIAGVIESEAGFVVNIDFLRTQAIVTRTYAIKNIDRHQEEGFSLCDLTHCQVYKSMSYSKNRNLINDAVNSTKTIVLVDQEDQIITSVFHSNCGGITANSEDVWLTKKSYLRSIIDTFCLNGKNARWTDTISFKESSSLVCRDFLERKKKYFIDNDSLDINNFRQKYNLPSTLFSVECFKKKAYLSGIGNGHGVGLCQEGAIRMGESGYNFKQILLFYYTGVKLFSYK